MALGAMRKDVLLMVFRSAAMSIGGGVLAGIILTITLHGVLAHWIQGGSLDALVLTGVIVLLLATSGLSCFIPARRASSVDPIVALRYE
jgi:putative ABC transport system permease protein